MKIITRGSSIIFIIVFLLSAESFSNSPEGSEHGNSGDVIICETESGTTTKLLDYYEGEVIPPYRTVSLGDPNWDFQTKVMFALERLMDFDEVRALAYMEKANEFFLEKDVRWVSGIIMEDIPDSGYIPKLEGCRIRQIAIQKTPVNPMDKLYTIDKTLWDRLSEDHKAGLVLHEITYSETLSLGQVNSITARKYTALISSKELASFSQEEYKELTDKFFVSPKLLSFKSDGFEFLLYAGEPFFLNLETLLCSKEREKLYWHTLEPLPPSLRLDKRGFLSGTPTPDDASSRKYNLIVNDGFDGTVVPLTLTIVPKKNIPPIWVVKPIRLPDHPMGRALSFDFAPVVFEPCP